MELIRNRIEKKIQTSERKRDQEEPYATFSATFSRHADGEMDSNEILEATDWRTRLDLKQ